MNIDCIHMVEPDLLQRDLKERENKNTDRHIRVVEISELLSRAKFCRESLSDRWFYFVRLRKNNTALAKLVAAAAAATPTKNHIM